MQGGVREAFGEFLFLPFGIDEDATDEQHANSGKGKVPHDAPRLLQSHPLPHPRRAGAAAPARRQQVGCNASLSVFSTKREKFGPL